MFERRCRAEQLPRLNGERDLTASLNIPGGAIAANDGVNAFNRAYHFFYIRFMLLLPLRRNRAPYLLLRNLKPLEKKEMNSHYMPDLAFMTFCQEIFKIIIACMTENCFQNLKK